MEFCGSMAYTDNVPCKSFRTIFKPMNRPNFIDHAGFHFTVAWDFHWNSVKFMIPNCYSSKLLEKFLKLHIDVCAFLVWLLSGKVLKFDSSYRTVKNFFTYPKAHFLLVTRHGWLDRLELISVQRRNKLNRGFTKFAACLDVWTWLII